MQSKTITIDGHEAGVARYDASGSSWISVRSGALRFAMSTEEARWLAKALLELANEPNQL